MSALEWIGKTRLVPLSRLAKPGGAKVWLKLEYENPTGSMKDRMALAMVEGAERDGRLKTGGSVVEYTGGSTGVSLAYVCAAKRYPLRIVTSEAFSAEKRNHMSALGAELTLVPSPTGGTTKALTLEMIETARQLAEEHQSYWTDQLNNVDQVQCYPRLADEIWQQADQRVDAFVQTVGTSGSIRGIGTRLKELNPAVRIVAVEPAESAVLSGGESGSHKIEGAGPGFVPPLWNPEVIDDITSVSSSDAMAMARTLAKEEGIFAGTSTGSNVKVALQMASEMSPAENVVTLAVDSGMKYLSTALYAQ